MLEAAGEVQGRARETGRGGEEGRENTSCQGCWIEDQADTGLPDTASHGSNYSPQIQNVFSIFCFIHKSNPDPAQFLNNKSGL